MARLRALDPAALSDAQRALYDAIQRGPRGPTPLVGPYAVWVRAPAIGSAVQALGAVARFETALDEAVKEVTICTVGAHFEAKFEFAAHRRLARAAGVDDALLEAIRLRAAPAFARHDQALAHALTRQLLEQKRIDDSTYAASLAHFGERALVELVSLAGYYSLVCMTLNAFEVPLPAEMADPFPHRP